MVQTSMMEAVTRIADHVEDRIMENISLDNVSALVHLSKYHLDRIFKAVTGQPLMAYVRARKLTRSLDPLLGTDLRILDIALEYGFSHEQSYTRAFKNTFQTTPAEFRRQRTTLRIQERLNPLSLHELGPGLLIKPFLVLKPEFCLVGLRSMVADAEDHRDHIANRLGQEFYYRHSARIGNAVRPSVYIGLVRHLDGNEAVNSYMPSLEVESLEKIPPGMAGEVIPTHKYAVFRFIGLMPPDQVNVEILTEVYDSMWHWLRASGHGRAGNFHFEWIDTDVAREDYCEVDHYLPIL